MNFIITPLRWIIDLLYSWVGSYSIAIILFTLVVKLILLPLDIKQRHSMRKMQLIQPKVDEINKKYEKDPEKRSAKTMELYKKEKCNPMSGCLPMLIQMPILFAMFAVMRHIAGEQAVLMVQSVADGVAYQPEGFLWIANIWQPDNIMAKIIPSLTDLAGNLTVVNGNSLLSAENIELIRANYEIIMKPVMEVYNVGKANGWAILPLLAGASQYFTTWLMNGKQTEKIIRVNSPVVVEVLYNAVVLPFLLQGNRYAVNFTRDPAVSSESSLPDYLLVECCRQRKGTICAAETIHFR